MILAPPGPKPGSRSPVAQCSTTESGQRTRCGPGTSVMRLFVTNVAFNYRTVSVKDRQKRNRLDGLREAVHKEQCAPGSDLSKTHFVCQKARNSLFPPLPQPVHASNLRSRRNPIKFLSRQQQANSREAPQQGQQATQEYNSITAH